MEESGIEELIGDDQEDDIEEGLVNEKSDNNRENGS